MEDREADLKDEEDMSSFCFGRKEMQETEVVIDETPGWRVIGIPMLVTSCPGDVGGRRHPEHRRSLKKWLPWWTRMELNPQQLLEGHFPQYQNAFAGLSDAGQRYAAKLMHLYVHGGIVIDDTMNLTGELESYFYSDSGVYLLPSVWGMGLWSSQFIASKKGQLLWLKVLDGLMLPGKKAPFWLGEDLSYMVEFSEVLQHSNKMPVQMLPYSSFPVVSSLPGEAGWHWWCWQRRRHIFYLALALLILIIILILYFCWSSTKGFDGGPSQTAGSPDKTCGKGVERCRR